MTRPADEVSMPIVESADKRAVAPIDGLGGRPHWCERISADLWIVCSDPRADRWGIWDRHPTDRDKARRRLEDYGSRQAAKDAAEKK